MFLEIATRAKVPFTEIFAISHSVLQVDMALRQ
ncbi:hypothetical protein NIES2100_28900 [Calothrix sp. NIES-2100]|nr:hypothetical protein NIES2100_28900 [Calothrix sp. NIES-2100]